MPDRLEVRPVRGLPDVRPGADLVALIAGAAPWLVDHDVVVVTSKVVSKAEGRLVAVPPDPDAREKARLAAVEEQTVREVARRGTTRIVETRHGLVLAAAGVDASNVRTDELALLPEDPDASARQLRDGLRRALGVEVAVVVSDTMGRPWRHGLVDQAIGVAGMRAVRDYRGRIDPYGNALARTEIAEADEVAAAAELVKGKLAGVPVAVVRGLSPVDDAAGARPLRRPAEQDMFRLGTAQAKRHAVLDRRSVRVFADVPVDRDVVLRAVAAAATAAAPRRTTPWRFVLVETSGTRRRLLEALRTSWVEDLRADGLDELRRGGVLERAPYLAVPCLVRAGARGHPDARRAAAEATAFHLAMGAGVQNFLVSLAAEGLGSCWVAAPLYCPDVVRRELELPADWEPTGAVAIGAPAEPLAERRAPDPGDFVLLR